MLRLQDIMFGILGLALAALMAFRFEVALVALLGAFACGSIYVFAGMLPSSDEGFLQRALTTVFLSIVLASLVLIVPLTLGPPHPQVQKAAAAIAGLLPLTAFGFEVARTPRVIQAILRCFGYR